MDRRIDHLVEQDLARRQGQRVIFARDLLNTLRRRELDEAAAKLSAETGLAHRPSAEGEHVSGVYRQRVTLASGRFAMIDDGMGFQLVPWRPALEHRLGQHVTGTLTPGGGVDWNIGRKRGLRPVVTSSGDRACAPDATPLLRASICTFDGVMPRREVTIVVRPARIADAEIAEAVVIFAGLGEHSQDSPTDAHALMAANAVPVDRLAPP